MAGPAYKPGDSQRGDEQRLGLTLRVPSSTWFNLPGTRRPSPGSARGRQSGFIRLPDEMEVGAIAILGNAKIAVARQTEHA